MVTVIQYLKATVTIISNRLTGPCNLLKFHGICWNDDYASCCLFSVSFFLGSYTASLFSEIRPSDLFVMHAELFEVIISLYLL